MCFSVEVVREMKKTAERFHARISFSDLAHFEAYQKKASDLSWLKDSLGLRQRPSQNPIRLHDDDGRIYPGYFTSVVVWENGERVLKPMRYRVRPQGSKEEIPSKFNVFNARLDSLETRQTWSPLFTRHHGLLPFRRFFEWVEADGKKRLISFRPRDHDVMWAPCLWDWWERDGFGFYSFALITGEPPKEISERGHDRCPIFLREDLIDEWLNSDGKSKSDFYRLLASKEETIFEHEFVKT